MICKYGILYKFNIKNMGITEKTCHGDGSLASFLPENRPRG